MDRTESQIVERLDAVLVELRAIRAALPRHAPGDAEKLGDLLESIQTPDIFTAAELVEFAAGPGAQALRGAIVSVIGSSQGGVRRLARFLARHSGEWAGGKRLERVGRSGHGERYRVI